MPAEPLTGHKLGPVEVVARKIVSAGGRQRCRSRLRLRRSPPLRVVPTRANGQPAFGCYLDDRHALIARPFGFLVLTLDGEQISAITFFNDTSVFAHFGLPRTLPRA